MLRRKGRLVRATIALCALVSTLALSACAQPGAQSRSNLAFATSPATTGRIAGVAPAARVAELRVLSRQVNLQEPLLLAATEQSVTITIAIRLLEGATFTVSPSSLAPLSVTPYAYPAHAKRAAPLLAAAEGSSARLDDGGSFAAWTDEQSGRVLVQVFGPAGTWLGSPVAVSPEGMDVYGSPQIVAVDARHAVAAFFACTGDGFQLVAASIERLR